MKNHYNLTTESYNALKQAGVTDSDLFKSIPLFDPIGSGEPLTHINLLYYIDTKGNFNDPPTKLAHKKIAKAIFNQLPIKQKISVAEYLESFEDNFND